MAVNPMLSSGIHGLQSALDRVAQAAADVLTSDAASPVPAATERPASGQDQIDALMDLKLYQREVQASAKVVQTADEVIGFLLDIKA